MTRKCNACRQERDLDNFKTQTRPGGSLYRKRICRACENRRQLLRKRTVQPETTETIRGDFTYQKKRRGKGPNRWASDLWEGWVSAVEISQMPWCPLEVAAVRRRLESGQSLKVQFLHRNEFNGYHNPPGTKERVRLLAFPAPAYRPRPTFGVWT